MNKKGMGTEEVKDLMLLVLGIVVIVGAVIVIWGRVIGPAEAEGLRTKVELAALGKGATLGLLTSDPKTFSCETQRAYWEFETEEDLAKEIEKYVKRVRYSYGEDEQLDFFSDFNIAEKHVCYVCAIVSNSKELGPSSKLNDLLFKRFIRDNKNPPPLKEFYGPFYDYDASNDLTGIPQDIPFDFNARKVETGPQKLLFIGYGIDKFREAIQLTDNVFVNPAFAENFVGRSFVLNQENLNEYCSEDLLFIDV